MPSSTALYSLNEIRSIEQAALSALPPGTLMERAGKAATEAAQQLLGTTPSDVLVLAGPGNNGGDALVAARLLAEAGQRVTVLLCADPARQPPDAHRAFERATSAAINIVRHPDFQKIRTCSWHLVIDGLFGIGLGRPISGDLYELVEAVNALSCPVLALDIPSGLDADTGNVVGPSGVTVRASHTVTFIGDKPGLHTGYGRDYAGTVQVTDLGIESRHFVAASAFLNGVEAFASSLRPRPHNSHKGSYGDVIVIGGAQGMAGAPILSARAAAKCGAGRVFVAFLDQPPAYDSVHPELMCRSAADIEFGAATLVIGPGLSTSDAALRLLDKALKTRNSLVLDADALNLIAAHQTLRKKLKQRQDQTLMTPHPLEAARLLQCATSEVQADRLLAARRLAQEFNAVVVLKGSGSVIARPDGQLVINRTGNPALATAGTGDVLAGMCGALLAQAVPVWPAALASVWLHGAAADVLVAEGIGPIGMTASELIPAARTLLNQLTAQHA